MAQITTYPKGTPKNADYLLGTSTPAANTDDLPVTKNFAISDVSKLVSKGYKSYVFIFSQSGTDNPTVTEIDNDTGLTFTFTRGTAGNYHLVPSASFDLSKTWAQVTGGDVGQNTYLNIKNYQTNLIAILNIESTTGNTVDGVTTGFVELRIYN